ncbi:bifunctional 4-hydroxy-2-oxoglutarate aldolase/2-dehydro-3-deoxy-phosphogluconate aldolase [Glaciibacter superstes]|uniref:bifunctional 4-hydroxy-2-oxoglutarate aldolase/2-dehydro-3-deoxy-phosphogluconate aldolase n=1 Tax=Glaciibacter superstes TaxID=501023 RepID=UPI0003B35FF4|nr:bifunctional 4-hydroxy-2-oxoglutarate aldolase/2-dehydro-3-deoxy-phosphogluconate aldolase [Glaciibacter superstes]
MTDSNATELNGAVTVAESQASFDGWFSDANTMAILRGYTPERTVELAERAWEMGFALVEVPVQDDRSLASLRATVEAGAAQGRPVGAGTVISAELAATVADAGAAFTVAPGWDPLVATASLERGMPHLPGVMTASDVQQASAFGLNWLKLFPASIVGSDMFPALHGPFPKARFVATGGIDETNAEEFLAKGAAVVSLGSAIERVTDEHVRMWGRHLSA